MLKHAILGAALCGTIQAAELGAILWTFPTGGSVFASPTIGTDGTLYIGSNNSKFFALTPTPTAVVAKWAFAADDWIDSSAAVGPDGTLYFGTYDSTLYAVNPGTGVARWTFKLGAEEGTLGVVMGSPAIAADGTIIVATTTGYLHAVSAKGTQLWASELDDEIRASPVIDRDGNIYIGTHGGKLHSLTAGGQPRWVFDAGGEASRIRSSAAIDRDGHVYFGTGDGFLYSLTSAGALRWKFKTDEPVDCSPAISQENRIYFASRDGSFHCLSQAGETVWSKYFGDVFYSSPVMDTAGFVYLAYFAGAKRSKIVCLSPEGDEVWATQIDAVIDSSPTLTPDGLLCFGAFDGKVYALKAGQALDQSAPWPRFRKDIRGRGRIIEGTPPSVSIPPKAALLTENSQSNLTLSASNFSTLVWRKNCLPMASGLSTLPVTGTDESVALYDALITNDFGETLSPPSFLAVLAKETYTVSASDRRYSASYIVPTLGNWEAATSDDLSGWTIKGVAIDFEPNSPTTRLLKASTPGTSKRFLRLQLR